MNKSFLCILITANLLPLNIFSQTWSLDPSYDSDGIVIASFGTSDDQANAIVLQSDGKVIAGGYATVSGEKDFALARFNTDGSIDASFGVSGKVITDMGSDNDYITSMVLQPDGKIVVAGAAENSGNWDFAVARYNADGSLDNSFDIDGKVITPILIANDIANGVDLQSDGKIIVAGTVMNGGSSEIGLARFNTNGSLDNSFDMDGIITRQIGVSNCGANCVIVQHNDEIIVGGYYYYDLSAIDGIMVHFGIDGSTGTWGFFGNDIFNPLYGGDHVVFDITEDLDSNLATAGYYEYGTTEHFGLLSSGCQSDGQPDTSFPNDAWFGFQIMGSTATASSKFYSIEFQSDGRMVVGGYYEVDTLVDKDLAMMRFSVDLSVWEEDIVTDISGGDDVGKGMVIQTDGKIVLGGYTHNGSSYDFVLARYIDATVGVDEILDDHSIVTIYPNPSTGTFTIESQTNISSIEITNVMGMTISSMNVGNTKANIDLSGQPKGIYFYKIYDGNKILGTGKLILE